MKTKTKKAIALALCAVMLIAGTALTTVAYLTDKEAVVNTFTVGEVHIDLDEAYTDEYGVIDNSKPRHDGTEGKLGNTYKLIPACTYAKDPTVTVKEGSEPCYVRMIVEITKIADVKEAFGITQGYFYPEILVGETWDSETWIATSIVEKEGSAFYEFRYNGVVDAREEEKKLDALFDAFTIPSTITELTLPKLNDVQVKISAHAIQEAGFKNKPNDAWLAFDNQYNPPVEP